MKKETLLHSLVFTAAAATAASGADFGGDAAFLQQHTDLILLRSKDGQAQVAVAPAWQGRVMTSTAAGPQGRSFGWLNRDLIASGKWQEHINVFGGEDRFWMGPEGGQFSVFFAKGSPFELSHWFTPAPVDTMPYRVVRQAADRAVFGAEFKLTNYSGTTFDVQVERTVRVLEPDEAWRHLAVKPAADVKLVAFQSENKITNAGRAPWRKESGLLSVWILGQFNPTPETTIVVPIKSGPESELGVKATSDYFGAIPADRFRATDHAVYLKADGQFRSKIGINPRRSRAVLGSYDAGQKVLTLVQFTQPAGVTDYVNSLWKLQEHPYAGDAANSYNDGPPSPGAKPLGPFYELESSSPAAVLAPGASLAHVHRTIHLTGPEPALNAIAQQVLGVSLADIQHAFTP